MSKSIHDIPEADRPREKLLRKGAAALSDQELLAVLIGKGTPGMDVMTLAAKLARVIDEKGLAVKAEDLSQFAGVGTAKATLILAAIEFARRRIKPEGAKIVTPDPSGELGPSPSDIAITAQLKAAGEIVGIELLDHIIFNRSGYFSFLEAGRL